MDGHQIQEALPNGLYAFNLINSPSDPAAEARSAELYVKNSIKTVEASAYVDLTVPLVYYRVAGLAQNPDGSVQINNRVIAQHGPPAGDLALGRMQRRQDLAHEDRERVGSERGDYGRARPVGATSTDGG